VHDPVIGRAFPVPNHFRLELAQRKFDRSSLQIRVRGELLQRPINRTCYGREGLGQIKREQIRRISKLIEFGFDARL